MLAIGCSFQIFVCRGVGHWKLSPSWGDSILRMQGETDPSAPPRLRSGLLRMTAWETPSRVYAQHNEKGCHCERPQGVEESVLLHASALCRPQRADNFSNQFDKLQLIAQKNVRLLLSQQPFVLSSSGAASVLRILLHGGDLAVGLCHELLQLFFKQLVGGFGRGGLYRGRAVCVLRPLFAGKFLRWGASFRGSRGCSRLMERLILPLSRLMTVTFTSCPSVRC